MGNPDEFGGGCQHGRERDFSLALRGTSYFFSSNGLPGFGGYDLFNANYDHEGVVPGSVRHFLIR